MDDSLFDETKKLLGLDDSSTEDQTGQLPVLDGSTGEDETAGKLPGLDGSSGDEAGKCSRREPSVLDALRTPAPKRPPCVTQIEKALLDMKTEAPDRTDIGATTTMKKTKAPYTPRILDSVSHRAYHWRAIKGLHSQVVAIAMRSPLT